MIRRIVRVGRSSRTNLGEVMGCRQTKSDAEDQLVALNVAGVGDRAADGFEPTAGMVEEAQKGLDWRSEFGRGGTAVGIARARDIVNGRSLPIDTVRRMNSFFARHEVDKEAEGFRPGEPGFPSNGRIAWALWGGDAGQTWSARIVGSMEQKAAEQMTETRDGEGMYPLGPRQNAIYEDLEEIVDIFGPFDQGIGADGAHYAGPDVNPFAAEGMVCSNCVFYEGPQGVRDRFWRHRPRRYLQVLGDPRNFAEHWCNAGRYARRTR